MEFDEDDWFFRSIKEYEDLYMYDLQTAASVLSWSGQKEACISCNHLQTKSELAYLRLPPKLTSTEGQIITKDRDFKVFGGAFTDSLITDLYHHDSHGLLLSAEKGENYLQTWSLPKSEHGLMQKEKKYNNLRTTSVSAKLAVSSTDNPKHVAFGSHGSDICLVDLECDSVDDIGLDTDDRLCSLHWTGPHSLLAACQDSGNLWIIDTRQKSANKQIATNQQRQGPWAVDFSSSSGRVYLINTEGVVRTTNINSPHTSEAWDTELRMDDPTRHFTIRAAPTEDGTFSISGCDGCVYIYNLLGCEEGIPLKANFIHQGHMANTAKVKVVDHIWHPTMPCLLLSAGDDSSLHAWKYSDFNKCGK